MAAPPGRIGRPLKAAGSENRRYFGVQMPLHLRAQLEEAAQSNHRSLSAEALARLEASFHDEAALYSLAARHQGLRLIAMYMADGAGAVVRLVTSLPDLETGELPDEAERRRRWQEMVDTLAEARWASPEAEDRWQRIHRRFDEIQAEFRAFAEAAAKPEDEAA